MKDATTQPVLVYFLALDVNCIVEVPHFNIRPDFDIVMSSFSLH